MKTLAADGWILFRCTAREMETPGPFCFMVAKAIRRRRPGGGLAVLVERYEGGGGEGVVE